MECRLKLYTLIETVRNHRDKIILRYYHPKSFVSHCVYDTYNMLRTTLSLSAALQIIRACVQIDIIIYNMYAFLLTHHHPQSTPNCTIREPIYNHTFDLAGLRSALAHKVPLAGGAFLELNACGAIIKRCAGLTEATVCHTSATGGERVLGTNFALKLRDGQLQLELDGGKCNSTDDFRTRVQLVCSYAQQRRPFEVLSEAACAYGLVWYTELACMPLPVELRPEQQQQQRPAEACAVHDPKTGHVFDLSALAGRRNNG